MFKKTLLISLMIFSSAAASSKTLSEFCSDVPKNFYINNNHESNDFLLEEATKNINFKLNKESSARQMDEMLRVNYLSNQSIRSIPDEEARNALSSSAQLYYGNHPIAAQMTFYNAISRFYLPDDLLGKLYDIYSALTMPYGTDTEILFFERQVAKSQNELGDENSIHKLYGSWYLKSIAYNDEVAIKISKIAYCGHKPSDADYKRLLKAQRQVKFDLKKVF